MNPTIGVTKIGPMTGTSCSTASGGVCGRATTAGRASAAAHAVTVVASVASDCTVRAVAIPVFPVEPTASRVALVDAGEALDFFFFFGAGSVTADFVSLESVDAVVFSSAGCLLSVDDVPEVEFVDDD